MQVLYFTGLTFIATMGSSDISPDYPSGAGIHVCLRAYVSAPSRGATLDALL
ncbi:MAG: hypothetical protein KJ714_00260 [Euryarchaeota archaeon]|nr:hypothetical protein [Euryarchaeota archaeon]